MTTSHLWPDYYRERQQLLQAIQRLYEREPLSRLAVGGSWASSKTLFHEPEAKPLTQWILTSIDAPAGALLDGWALYLDDGDAVQPHDHLRSHHGGENALAGVLWLQYPSEGRGGLFCYGETEMQPVQGTMVVFPASMPHWVTRYSGPRRVTVSWNLKHP